MCNLGEGLLERGIEEGREAGREEGREEGFKKGMVETVKSLVGDDFDKVCEIIRRNAIYMNVSDAEIRKYW